ncbi:MAG: type III pantothenate kinase [Candidatus Omnitrophica bacterium]|nr:type III pantothenate kinase [Candidatus Omnitrophota bacterium]
MMLLAIDIGNTSVAFGVFRRKRLKSSWKIPTQGVLSKKTIKLPKGIKTAILSSVVPKATPIIKKAIEKKYKIRPLVLGENIKAPIKNLYRKPGQVGQDRLVDAVAVKELYGCPAIVIDFGTAITFDVISKKGEYLGGLIFPGIETSLNALSQKAALLPKIKFTPPKGLIGRDTADSMKSGVFHGTGALCDGVIAKLKAKYEHIAPGRGSPMKVIATGGHAALMAKYSTEIDKINPNLTLLGLNMIYNLEFNVSRRAGL